MFLVTLTPAAHRPIRDAQDLGRFPPFQLAGRGLQNHFLYLHHPLHFCSRDLLFDGFHINQLSPRCVSSGHFTCYLTRTTHMLPTPVTRHFPTPGDSDVYCAEQTPEEGWCATHEAK